MPVLDPTIRRLCILLSFWFTTYFPVLVEPSTCVASSSGTFFKLPCSCPHRFFSYFPCSSSTSLPQHKQTLSPASISLTLALTPRIGFGMDYLLDQSTIHSPLGVHAARAGPDPQRFSAFCFAHSSAFCTHVSSYTRIPLEDISSPRWRDGTVCSCIY